MILILKKNASEKQVEDLVNWLHESFNVQTNLVNGTHQSILGLIGDTSKIDIDRIRTRDEVEDVKRVQEPYKNTNRKFHPDDTVIEVMGRHIGGGKLNVIAGPCSVESEEGSRS